LPRWVLVPLVTLAFVGNVIEAAADLGGMGSAVRLFVPVATPALVLAAAVGLYSMQYFAGYDRIRTVFRWLALALFTYVAAAILAHPHPVEVLRHTFVPHVQFNSEFLAILVACQGTALSAYVYTWQSNQEVEEQIGRGRRRPAERRGASRREVTRTGRDVFVGMVFSNLILYFILLATGLTLHPAGQTKVDSAAQAAAALEPVAGAAAKLLFAAGIVGVGLLAVPVMTTGAAYDLVQGMGREGSLHERPRQNPPFYAAMGVVTALAVALNFLGVNPMRALVLSGIVQGFSVPPLLLVMMLLTNRGSVLGERGNGRWVNGLGGLTTAVSFLATVFLVGSWFG
jgi:Mn2+/Fe2+ NRAMP family transporter